MDGPGQGEAGFRLPIRHDYEVAVAAMLDALGGRDDLDLERVGAAGVSLGGYYAPRAAAFEPRIRAVAGDQRPVQLRRGVGRAAAAHARGVHRQVGRARRARRPRARARARPRPACSARSTQPALFVTGGLDRIIPWRQTERAAREAPNGIVRAVRAGHARVQQRPLPLPPARGGLDGGSARARAR